MSWTQSDYQAVLGLLGSRTGLNFAPSRYENAALGIRRAMSRAGVSDLAQYHCLIDTDASALDDLIVELTVGETYFFRDPRHFDFIRREVLPDVRRRRGEEHMIRTWSAGCASGEEAYSLAILFEQEGLAGRTHILATDISRAALAKARQATYGEWALRGEGAATAKRYLTRRGDCYLLDLQLRGRVAFEYLNLAVDVYPSFATSTWGMDLILCRNVLIYFDTQTIQNVARRLFASLADGGWLIAGPSDPLVSDYAPFETLTTDAGLFYRRKPSSVRPNVAGGLDHEATERHRDLETTVGGERTLEPAAQAVFAQPGCELGVTPAPAVSDSARSLTSDSDSEDEPPNEAIQSDEGAETRAVSTVSDPLAEAREALGRCDYQRVVTLTRGLLADAAAAVLHVRAIANLDATTAERTCGELTERHPLSTELRYLQAVLLMELGRDRDAVRAARRVTYLDRSLATAHFTLGSVLRRSGDVAGAQRAYRNARDLARARPADEIVPLSDGDCAARLAEAAEAQLALLNGSHEMTR